MTIGIWAFALGSLIICCTILGMYNAMLVRNGEQESGKFGVFFVLVGMFWFSGCGWMFFMMLSWLGSQG